MFVLPLLQLTCQTSFGAPPDDWRKNLPEPVVAARPGWVDLYYGYLAEAREIAINGLDGMLETWKKTGTLFENYNQEKPGAPGGSSKADFVGWSGVQPIATLIETIIGIRTHAPRS
jgi:hypothetical protein